MNTAETGKPGRSPRAFAVAIRGSAIGLLVGAAVCLFLGFSLAVDAPGGVSDAATQRWFTLNTAINWCLRVVGVWFLIAALLAALTLRVALLIAVITEVAFTLLMFGMSVVWTWQARIGGGWNYQVVLLILVGILSLSGAKASWGLYQAARREAGAFADPSGGSGA